MFHCELVSLIVLGIHRLGWLIFCRKLFAFDLCCLGVSCGRMVLPRFRRNCYFGSSLTLVTKHSSAVFGELIIFY